MTKEEVNIVCDLYDMKAELIKCISLADDLADIYNATDEVESYKYQMGKRSAYTAALKIISKEIDKLRKVETNGTTDEKTKSNPM